MKSLKWVRRITLGLVGMVAAAALASCGGGNDNGGPPPAPPPASNLPPPSASGSVDGFIAYLKTLVVTKQDTVEPLDVTGFTAPTSDTTEPDPSV